MCGISGIINYKKMPVEKELIRHFNNLMRHRGPDDEGYYFGFNFALGHRRLSIIDLSEKGHQPMEYLDKYTIVFNGEIYNYIEIKDILKKQGYHFNTNSDTEVILASYDYWGELCVNQFNGMWAFAIYDKLKNNIFLSRDRYGIKPLYFCELTDRFVFSSELKPILSLKKNRYVNKKILMDFLYIGYEDHTDETFFNDVFSLRPSHNLVFNLEKNNFTINKYYNIEYRQELKDLPADEISSIFEEKFTNSIKLRLRSDVKVGTCLSGGLDSSSIATIGSEMYHQNSNESFSAITAKSFEPDTDESNYASMIAKNSNLDWHTTEPNKQTFLNSLDNIVFALEEPFCLPNVLMQYFVFEKAKQIKCKVMLDGQGGDEVLLGYERYYPSYLRSLPITKIADEFLKISKNSKLSKVNLLMYMIYFISPFIRKMKLNRTHSHFNNNYKNIANLDLINKQAKKYKNIFELQKSEINEFQLLHLLKYEDRNSMIHSIESRLPFLDYEFLEFALSVDPKFKIYNGYTKHILRNCMNKKMPDQVTWRKIKFGFNAPAKFWQEEYTDSMKLEIRESKILNDFLNMNQLLSNFKKIDFNKRWRYFSVALWEKMLEVQISN